MEVRELLAASFFAAAEPTGNVNVQLVPLANVTAGAQEIVTFGLPFTLGSVTAADLAKVRVLKNGVEVPAFVEQLTPWRSIDNPALDGQFVRVARIQIPYTFSALAPESITVAWGGAPRTQNRTSFQDPRLEWHTVTSGTFVAADNVEEPDVLPVLPGAYLSKGMLDARTDPTNSSVAETRDDPAIADARTFTGYDEYDTAQKNFFYTIINQNPGITIDYKTQSEPWLYDRSSAMYELYLRSGFATALREAVRSTDFYVDHLDSSGFFTLKPGDPKYSYNESLAYTYWLLGDDRMLPKISTVVNAHSSTNTRWSPNLSFFTERNAGYKLLANEMAYEVTGNTTFKNNVQTIVGDLIYDQNGANGQLPANRVDGGLYHTGEQHDISEASSADVIIASSWMSVLVVDPMVRVYGVWQNSQVVDFIVRMGNFEKAASKTDPDGQFGGTTRYPDYLMRADGTTDNRSDTDVQHAMDVGSVAAWATYFAELRGTPDPSLRQLANDLYATYDVGVNFWTRPGGTNFNVSPPRRYAWEYKNSPSFSWALTGTDAPGQPGALQFSGATYSGQENQGTVTITVTRTGGSAGPVSVNYATGGGTAAAGNDYTATSGTLNFADGDLTKTFTIPIINDTLVEGDETVGLTLSNPTGGATLGSQSTATLTIVSDDVPAQPGALQFSASNYNVNEPQGTVTITVTRTGGSAGNVTVNYATGGGTATAGNDYTSTSGMLTFAAGETTKTFTIPITNDTLVEGDETVGLTLSNPTGGATLGSQSTATLTIVSDDVPAQPGVLQFSASNYSVNEPQGTLTVTVTRTGGSAGSVTVNYATGGGTATAGSDYTSTSGTLTFAAGETTKSFTVPILDDTDVEGPETVTLTLSNPGGGATLGSPATSTLTINSDDTSGQPTTVVLQQGVNGYTGTTDASISTQYAQFTGGNGNTSFDATQLSVYQTTGSGSYVMESLIRFASLGIPAGATVTGATLTLSVDTWDAPPTIRGYYVSAPWSGTPGTNDSQLGWLHRGTGTDWALPGALGQGTDVVAGKSFVLPGITPRGVQSISVNLDPAVVQSWVNNPSSNQGILLVNETLGNIVRINASENANVSFHPKLSITLGGTQTPQPGTLQFSAAAQSVNENQGTATITVTRTGGSAGPVSVNYATGGGTATAGSDYTSTSGTLNFADGELSKTFTIPISNDTLVEGDETIGLTLSNPTGGATLGSQSTSTLTIVSDDVAQPGSLQFSAANYSVNEPQGTVTITVTRTGGSNVPVSVNYATSGGTATAGNDYTAASGTLTFAAGETTKTFTIPIANDTLVEGDETVGLTLSNPTGGATLGSQATATLTIVSDDVAAQPGALQFSASNYSVNEPQGTVTITVTRTGGSDGTVTVNFATGGGTATAGSDYTSTSGTLTFAAGETTKSFTVPILDDTDVEGPETVTLTLSNAGGGATLGSPATSTLTINSDDTSGQPTTVVLQQGVNGYTGTTDASISTQYAQFTGGNGNTSFDATQLSVYQTTGSGSYVMESLIRFASLGIPAGATVTGATLTLSVDTWDAPPTIRGYYVSAPWSGTPGTNDSQLGWLHRGTGTDWALPGALGQGTDVVAGKSFVLPGITPRGVQSISVNLDPAVVQSWVNNPSSNQGILLVNETLGNIVRINASENANVSFHPKLSITLGGTQTPQPGTLQFSNPTYAVNENGGTATFTVTRTGGSAGPVSVNYATGGGTATAGNDYTSSSGTLNFADGETQKSFTVPISNDTLVEGNETVNLTLSNPTGGAVLGSQATAVLTIQDDDVAAQPGSLQFNAPSYSLAENGGALTVTVTRTGGTTGAVTVQYSTGGGTASPGSDYTSASGTLTFGNGEASKTFTVNVLDDTSVEGNETVTLTLSNPTGGATLGTPASVTFTIVDNDSSPGVVLPTGFTQTTVATGLSSGTALAAAPDGRVFALEQGGNVRVIKNGTLLATPAITVTTIAEQERGLIGIALDPNFATNQFVYVYYTVGGPSPAPAHNRVSRFTLNGDVAVPGSEAVLIDLPNVTNRIHNGGALKFGGDGKLYIAVGNDQVFGNSQDLTNPFGKILRINADGSIPTDNPFFNQTTGVNRAIWAYGLRNPYTFDVQPGTGLMYINDVGEADFEEIDQGTAGANYGWPDAEGFSTNPQFTNPVYAYAHGNGPHQGFAIVGAAFYNPATATFPSQYAGKYFYMDFVNGWIEYIDPSGPSPKTPTTFATNIPVRFDGGPVDLEVGADGALYYLDRLGGGVFKIQFTATTAQPPSITQQPASQSVTQGQPVTFGVTASSSQPLSYQWQKMDSGTSTFIDISGATSPSFTLSTTTAADNGDQFRVIVTNTAGMTTSNAALLTVTPSTPPPPPTGKFTNVTASSGIGAIISQKYQQTPDWWLSGEHLIDLDNDGDLDLYLSNHGGGSVVALNDGHGNFTRVTGSSFPDTEIHQMFDVNEDGKVDVSMTFQDGGGQWWLNNSTPGAVSFTATNITRGTNTSRAQVMMDFNGDGKVDWLRSEPPGLVVDYGNGNGSFTEDSVSFPIAGTSSNENANFLPADFDGDGDIDLLVLTGGGYDGTVGKTMLWRNNGNQTFTDITASSGIPANGTLAKGIGDFDQDGDTDFIAVENKSMPPAIYLNNGRGVFTKKAGAITGVAAQGLDYSAWGTAVSTDFDNDGIADIIMDGKYYLKILRGTGGGNFTYMNNAWGILDTAASSVDDGLSFGDFNGDGALDIIGYNETFPSRTLNVYRNDLPAQNWLNVRPVGLAGNKGAAGAKISLYAAGTNQLLWYEQVAAYDFQVATSYYAFGETERHFGLGNRAAVDVVVEFPGSGRVTRINNVAANQTIHVLESAGTPPSLAPTTAPGSAAGNTLATPQVAAFGTTQSGSFAPAATASPVAVAVAPGVDVNDGTQADTSRTSRRARRT